jgi:hypothetical protein
MKTIKTPKISPNVIAFQIPDCTPNVVVVVGIFNLF